jgi:tRNA U34 5-methylaminomethyl-2-thiouridine-forming methyltransferase MnmC
LEEAQKKYIEPLGVKDNQIILDICFGLGYNTLAAIENAKHLKIIALEKDPEVLEALQTLEINEKYNIIKQVAKDHYYKDENYEIKLILGPAEETIKQIKETFDIVFLDPFAPRNNPELWTEEFFKEIYSRMKKDAKLATYSCARKVRENLKAAGFKVIDGPNVGRRGPSTNAIKE